MLKKFILKKPFIPLSFTILVIILIAFYKKGYLADVQIFDAYFVLTINFLGGVFGMILLLDSIIYWLARNRKIVPMLTVVQVIGTIGITLYLICVMGSPPNSRIALGKILTIDEYRHLNELNMQFILGIAMLGLMQLLLVVNLIIGLMNKRTANL